MISNWMRIFQNNTDYSLANADKSTTIVVDGTSVVIAKKAAFNNFFIWMDTLNVVNLNLTLSYWSGKEWTNVVDLMDGSEGLTKSGNLQFSPNRKYKWSKVCDTSENGPSELNFTTIYDVYCLRIDFSETPTAGAAIKEISYKFTEDSDLLALDTDLDEFLPSFGQTDWIPQILTASMEVVIDLKKKRLIEDEGNVLRLEDVSQPTAYKALFLIYLSLGESYKDRRKEIKKLYDESFAGIYTFDKNNDGVVSNNEVAVNSGKMYR